jgi:hypothetical protein
MAGAVSDGGTARTRIEQDRSGPARWLPLLGWLGHYDTGTFRRDLLAGLTVAVMLQLVPAHLGGSLQSPSAGQHVE